MRVKAKYLLKHLKKLLWLRLLSVAEIFAKDLDSSVDVAAIDVSHDFSFTSFADSNAVDSEEMKPVVKADPGMHPLTVALRRYNSVR